MYFETSRYDVIVTVYLSTWPWLAIISQNIAVVSHHYISEQLKQYDTSILHGSILERATIHLAQLVQWYTLDVCKTLWYKQ